MPGWADLQPSSGADDLSNELEKGKFIDLSLAGLRLALVCQVTIDYAKSQ